MGEACQKNTSCGGYLWRSVGAKRRGQAMAITIRRQYYAMIYGHSHSVTRGHEYDVSHVTPETERGETTLTIWSDFVRFCHISTKFCQI